MILLSDKIRVLELGFFGSNNMKDKQQLERLRKRAVTGFRQKLKRMGEITKDPKWEAMAKKFQPNEQALQNMIKGMLSDDALDEALRKHKAKVVIEIDGADLEAIAIDARGNTFRITQNGCQQISLSSAMAHIRKIHTDCDGWDQGQGWLDFLKVVTKHLPSSIPGKAKEAE